MKNISLTHDKNILKVAADYLREKKIIAFPTDTIYGLCCLYDEEAIQKMHRIRRRESSKPFLLVLPEAYNEKRLIESETDPKKEKKRQKFMEKCWPGKKNLDLHIKKTGLFYPSTDTIALRKPSKKDNMHFYELLSILNQPVVAPSLNLPGEKPIGSFKEAEKKIWEP